MLTKYGTYTMREAMQRYLPMHYNGKTYMSISEPFCDHSRSLYPFYEGEVICIDECREDGFYAVYNAAWNVLKKYAACDWEKPFDIAPTGDFYNPKTGEIIK